jgi:hypothetical protein
MRLFAMTIEDFINAVKIQTSDAAVQGTIKSLMRPPGRKPREQLVQLSKWFNHLSIEDQNMLREVLKEAAEMAVFEFFCILDGVSVIEDTPDKGELELHFIKGAERTRLNDPSAQELHNLYNGLCQESEPKPRQNPEVKPYESGGAQQLKSKLKSGDELDIHHIPDKYSSMQTIQNYDPVTATAIALPKVEHRQMPLHTR